MIVLTGYMYMKYDDSSRVCALNEGALRGIVERVLLGQGYVSAHTGYYYSSFKSEIIYFFERENLYYYEDIPYQKASKSIFSTLFISIFV